MAKYANRIKRKQFVKDVKRRFVKMISMTTSETEYTTTLDKVIWKNIKEGLDFGLDIKYTSYENDNLMPSLENEYISYFGKSPTDREIDILFTALTSKLLPLYIDRYVDLELLTGENEFGKYFEINFK